MMAVSPWAFRNGKSHESFCWRKGEDGLHVDEGEKEKNAMGVT